MDRVSLALLSAVYDRPEVNLYHEVYFPIIRYTLVRRFRDFSNPDGYSDIAALKDAIREMFDIVIPSEVLRRALVAVSQRDEDIRIESFENGRSFKISSVWGDVDSYCDEVDRQTERLTAGMNRLEEEFRRYVDAERIDCDLTFVDFFAAHTEDILLYLNGEASPCGVNGEFVGIANFVSYLADKDDEAYELANRFFWAAVIAAFLRRENADFAAAQSERVEYYFDTPLVMACLDLSGSDDKVYADEIKKAILDAGHYAKVHPLTIHEIETILTTVANRGNPTPRSRIYEAWKRRRLTPSALLGIKARLRPLIEEAGFIVYRGGRREIDEIITEYKSKSVVRRLAKFRNEKPETDDDVDVRNEGVKDADLREIHDVYMHDFIKKLRRQSVSQPEHVNNYFLTLNTSLIAYFNEPRKWSCLLHSSKVICDLWIHGATSRTISQAGLTEVMSRCMAMNHSDACRKMITVAKYLKPTDDREADRQVGQAIFSVVLRRSSKAIELVDAIDELGQNPVDNDDEINEKIQDLKTYAEASVATLNGQVHQINERLSEVEQSLTDASEQLQAANTETATERIAKEKALKDAEAEREAKTKALAEKEAAEKDARRYKRIAELTTELESARKDKDNMEADMRKSISMTRYRWVIGLDIVLIIAVIGLLLSFWLFKSLWGQIASGFTLVAAITVVINMTNSLKNMKLLSPRIFRSEHIRQQEEFWKSQHSEYAELLQRIGQFEAELSSLKNNNA